MRFFRRFDGTVLAADCPVGLRAVRRQYLKARAKLVAAALAVWALVAGTSSSCSSPTVVGVPVIPDSVLHHDTTTLQETTVAH